MSQTNIEQMNNDLKKLENNIQLFKETIEKYEDLLAKSGDSANPEHTALICDLREQLEDFNLRYCFVSRFISHLKHSL